VKRQAGLWEAARKQHRSDQGAKFGTLEKHEEKGKSVEKAAQLMKVSHGSVHAADKVQKQGVEPLIAALGAGKVSVSAAARIAALPAEQQQTAVAGIESGLKPNQALAQAQQAPSSPAAAWPAPSTWMCGRCPAR
jgi:hypothetical protein